MTGKELSRLWCLKREIECEERRLHRLEDAATNISAKISGFPFCGGAGSDKTALGAEIADAKAIITAKQVQAAAEYNRLMRYISTIDDSYIRQIMELRHIDLYSWVKVARVIGGSNTADSVRMAHDRFLRKK